MSHLAMLTNSLYVNTCIWETGCERVSMVRPLRVTHPKFFLGGLQPSSIPPSWVLHIYSPYVSSRPLLQWSSPLPLPLPFYIILLHFHINSSAPKICQKSCSLHKLNGFEILIFIRNTHVIVPTTSKLHENSVRLGCVKSEGSYPTQPAIITASSKCKIYHI